MNIDLSVKDINIIQAALDVRISELSDDPDLRCFVLDLRRKVGNLLSCFNTQCPVCETTDELYVVRLIMGHSGKNYIVSELLEPYGFSLPQRIVEAEPDLSTTNEEVECLCCGHRFPLSSLLREF